ncbi:MAG: hypothetical protein E4H40_05030, partial [Candidatus Brocadiia bacterium]
MAYRALVLCFSFILLASCNSTKQVSSPAVQKKVQISENILPGEVSLFDGRDLGQWKVTEFADHGKVYAKDEGIMLETGDSLTGVTWGGDVVRKNYQLDLDAMRVEGDDFFCGLTFPVGES